MKYKYLTDSVLARIDDDGRIRMTCSVEHPPFLAWLAQGNVPDPADSPQPIALSCSPWQMRKALRRLGLLNAVKQAVEASDNEDLKDGWEYATEFRQDDPLCIAMAQAMKADLTAVFQLAMTI